MSRPLRIEFPGAHYHVTSRGNARRKIFLDDVDREVFLVTLAWVIERSITRGSAGFAYTQVKFGCSLES